jgi:hypothetical protein
MPYIRPTQRDAIATGHMPETAGELNFLFTMIVKNYMQEEESYQRYNDCIGALEGCKLELYARKIRPYEDVKIKENGDVY